MPLLRAGGQQETAPKQDDFVQRIEAGKVLPIVSDEVITDLVLGSRHALTEKYAELTQYPLPDRDDLPKMAKFYAIDQDIDDWGLKNHYFDVVKTYLYDRAKDESIGQDMLDQAEDQFDRVSPSQIASLLDYPRFDDEHHPLLILANLKLPIYVTTCCHTMMEAALTKAGRKAYRTDYLRWQRGLDDDETVLTPEYKPSSHEPLVYHLFGVDTCPDSLVLTEDDYLRFLIAVSSEKGRTTELLPSHITTAFSTSSLLMLGFRLRSWAFRVIFYGLIKNSQNPYEGRINLQLRESAEESKYLEAYLKEEAKFEVFWGDIHKYTRDLYERWKGQE